MKTDTRTIIAVAVSAAAIAGVLTGPAGAQAPPANESPRYAAPGPPAFACVGNEPSWSLRIVDEEAVFDGADKPERPFSGELTWLENSGIYAWNGRANDARSDKLEALIDEHRCRDTMAGEILPYRVRVSLPGAKRVEGCCRTGSLEARPLPQTAAAKDVEREAKAAPEAVVEAAPEPLPAPSPPPDVDAARAPPPPSAERAPALAAEAIPQTVAPPPAAAEAALPPLPPGEAPIEAKADDDWARLLGELLPAIDVCLGRVDHSHAVVVKAWPMSDGFVGVRILDRDSRRWDCFAPATAHTVDRLEPVDRDAPLLPGEGSPVFTRAGGRPPRDECLRTEIISDETGRRVGWLSYKIC